MGGPGPLQPVPLCWGWMEELLANEGPGSCNLLAGRPWARPLDSSGAGPGSSSMSGVPAAQCMSSSRPRSGLSPNMAPVSCLV